MKIISDIWKAFIGSKLGLTIVALLPLGLIVLLVIWLYRKFIKNKK